MSAEARPTDDELLSRAMSPYVAKNAVLLERIESIAVDGGELITTGTFSIGESCYIDDTGHFNAVELVISYNQLMYASLAFAIRDKLLPELSAWTLDDYWPRQLPNVLITRLDSRYRSPLNPRAYRGTLRVHDFNFRNRTRPVLGFSSQMIFSDESGGSASTEVDIALTDPVGQ